MRHRHGHDGDVGDPDDCWSATSDEEGLPALPFAAGKFAKTPNWDIGPARLEVQTDGPATVVSLDGWALDGG